ncbi:MAG: hypothetical protein WCD18_03495 [Thermosynechococcaceae cyanobacterium]
MTERKRNPEEVLDEMVKKNVGFQVAELGSTLAAGAATIFLGVAKEAAVFAAAPLTLAIALNYFNRRQLDRLTRQQTLLDITEVQRRLSSEIQGIRGQAFEGSGNIELGNTNQFQGALASLSETVSALEMQMQQGGVGGSDPSHLEAELVQLRNHQLDLSQSLEAINQQLRNLPAEASSTHLDSEIAALKEQMGQIQNMPMAVSSPSPEVDLNALRDEFQGLLHPVHQNLIDLESRVAQSGAQDIPAPVDPEALRMEVMQLIAPVQQQVASLEDRVVAQPAAVGATVGTEELQTVHSQMSVLNEKLENVAAQLSAEMAGFQKSVEQTQDRMQDMHQQVQAVHQNLSATPASPDASVIHQEMQAAIGPLHEQITALDQKLGNMPTMDPNVHQLQAEQMVSLQNQLNSTNGLIEEVAGQFTTELSKVTADLTKIPQLIEETIDQKLSNFQSAAPQNPKKDAMSELDSILADINF